MRTPDGSRSTIPALDTVQWAAGKKKADSRLFADDVLEHLSPVFTSLIGLIPSTDGHAVISIDAAIPPCSHARLRRFISEEFDVAQFGLGRNDRISILFPNGPELAVAFVSVLCYCTCAPLNPQGTAAEIETELVNVGAKAMLVWSGSNPDVVALANKLGLVLIVAEAMATEETAGLFTMTGSNTAAAVAREPMRRSDTSFLLQTSGSTGNKKVVPHLLEDLIVGAVCIGAACELEPSDICCNQMPLYHIGGIARNILAPILSGGSVVAMSQFEPSLFWKIASTFGCTWYYAGPTMHMLILDTYKLLEPKPKIRLRFIANAAGPLLHSVAQDMRDTYSKGSGHFCSIMPSYGMTECMPISSPPVSQGACLPPSPAPSHDCLTALARSGGLQPRAPRHVRADRRAGLPDPRRRRQRAAARLRRQHQPQGSPSDEGLREQPEGQRRELQRRRLVHDGRHGQDG